jgi:hypothetical protein
LIHGASECESSAVAGQVVIVSDDVRIEFLFFSKKKSRALLAVIGYG